jgi:hypothetical protein
MLLQTAALTASWAAQLYLVATHDAPPPVTVLATATVMALALGALSVAVDSRRDRLPQDPAGRVLYQRFQFLCIAISLTVISLASGTYRLLHMPSGERGVTWNVLAVLLLIYLYAALALAWSLARRHRSGSSEP